jgi:hypothetical protein
MRAPIVDDRDFLANILYRCSVAVAQAQEDLRQTQPRTFTAGARLFFAESLLDTIVEQLRHPPPGEPIPRRIKRGKR